MKRFVALVLVVLCVAGLTTACSQRYATPTADEYLCVYDGSDRGGQKLKLQLGPGENSKEIDDNDVVVHIPASNRFFYATRDDGLRDPNAPQYYDTFAAKNVAVQVEGQVRFRFRDNACEWFAKHGRRNAINGTDMQFNARGQGADSSPWLHWLAENFGDSMRQALNSVASHYDAFALVFHYPVNANSDGVVPSGQTPGQATDVDLGAAVGPVFTKILNNNLGGEYFCGIDTVDGDSCPDITFQVSVVHTTDPSLEQGRQSVEKTRHDLEDAQLKGQLQQAQADAIAKSAAANAQILQANADAARLQAAADPHTAQCILFADHGLDCEGKRPAQYYNGQPTG